MESRYKQKNLPELKSKNFYRKNIQREVILNEHSAHRLNNGNKIRNSTEKIIRSGTDDSVDTVFCNEDSYGNYIDGESCNDTGNAKSLFIVSPTR